MEVLFWRRRSKTAGIANIYVRITVKGETLDVCSTGIKVNWEDWDAARRVLPSDPKAYYKNEQLLETELRLMAVYNELFRSNPHTITAGKVKRKYLSDNGGTTLLSAFDLYLKDVKANPNLTDATWEVYDNVRKKLLDFMTAQKITDLFVEDFDLTWLTKFRAWMKTVPLDGGKKGHEDSYIRKQSQTIVQVIRWAKLHKLTDCNPLEGMRIPGVKEKEPIYLTTEQFEQLRKHPFTNPSVQEVADVFIVYCRTGFHYGDLKDLTKKYHQAVRRGIDGETWIIKERIKTEVTARTPQFDEVKQIVEKYGGWEKLPIKSNKQMNTLLKVVAAELKFPFTLSTKIGRKTFTDWCFNDLGLTTDSVMVLLGRKSSKGLEVYGRPDERRVIVELKQSRAYQKLKNKPRDADAA